MVATKGAGQEAAATDLEARRNVGSGNARPSKPQPQNPQAPAKSWRDVLPVHPAADLFPLMSADELKALGEDIKKNGLKHEVVLWSPGDCGDGAKERLRYLLDGRNRLDAMERAGIKFLNDKGEPLEIHGARFGTERAHAGSQVQHTCAA